MYPPLILASSTCQSNKDTTPWSGVKLGKVNTPACAKNGNAAPVVDVLGDITPGYTSLLGNDDVSISGFGLPPVAGKVSALPSTIFFNQKRVKIIYFYYCWHNL